MRTTATNFPETPPFLLRHMTCIRLNEEIRGLGTVLDETDQSRRFEDVEMKVYEIISLEPHKKSCQIVLFWLLQGRDFLIIRRHYDTDHLIILPKPEYHTDRISLQDYAQAILEKYIGDTTKPTMRLTCARTLLHGKYSQLKNAIFSAAVTNKFNRDLLAFLRSINDAINIVTTTANKPMVFPLSVQNNNVMYHIAHYCSENNLSIHPDILIILLIETKRHIRKNLTKNGATILTGDGACSCCFWTQKETPKNVTPTPAYRK